MKRYSSTGEYGDFYENELDYIVTEPVIMEMKNDSQKDRMLIRSLFMEMAVSLIGDYDTHLTMGGLGGCLSVEAWLEKNTNNPIENCLKPCLKRFLDKGFFIRDFQTYVWDVTCRIQINQILLD